MSLRVKIETKAVESALGRLSVKKQNKVIRSALKNSLNIVTLQARRNFKASGVRMSSTQINKGIRTTVKNGALRGVSTAFASRGTNKQYMFRWYEYVTERYLRKKRNKDGKKIYRGKIGGFGFWRKAYDAKHNDMIPRLQKEVLKQLNKQWRN
mgnify:CR=1 FL=1